MKLLNNIKKAETVHYHAQLSLLFVSALRYNLIIILFKMQKEESTI